MAKTNNTKKLYLGQKLHAKKRVRFGILAAILIVAVASGFLLLRQSEHASAVRAYNCSFNPQHPTLKLGSRSTCVSHVQQAMNILLRPSPNLAVNGYYSIKTHQAVNDFQKRAGLVLRSTDYGTVESNTWNHIWLAGCYNKGGQNYGNGRSLRTIRTAGYAYKQPNAKLADCKLRYF